VGKITWKSLLRWLPAVYKMSWAAYVYSHKGKGIASITEVRLYLYQSWHSVLCKWRTVFAPITGILLGWSLVQAAWGAVPSGIRVMFCVLAWRQPGCLFGSLLKASGTMEKDLAVVTQWVKTPSPQYLSTVKGKRSLEGVFTTKAFTIL
jgi:hypothetical protein